MRNQKRNLKIHMLIGLLKNEYHHQKYRKIIKINAKFLITFHFLDKKSKTRNNGKIKNIKGRLANTIFYLYLINICLSTILMAYSTTKLKNHNLSKLLISNRHAK